MAYNLIADIGEIQLARSTYSFENGNPCNILTRDNIVILCDNILVDSYTANSILATLSNPSTMAPSHDIIIPIYRITNNSTYNAARLKINTNGELSVSSAATNGKILLNGICFHVNDKYYNPAIGNIYNNGTSPLSVE